MPDPSLSAPLPRYGLICKDPLRILGLRTILGDGERCDVVLLSPPAASSAAGLAVCFMDSPEDGDAVELVVLLRRLLPHLPVIVLGRGGDPEHIERVIGAGAKGYLRHSSTEAELTMAIDVVRDGSVWAPRKVMARLLHHALESTDVPPTRPVTFTPRELEVLRLLVLGQPNRQIADALGVDESTVKAHMGRLMRKAGVENRTALSVRALREGWK